MWLFAQFAEYILRRRADGYFAAQTASRESANTHASFLSLSLSTPYLSNELSAYLRIPVQAHSTTLLFHASAGRETHFLLPAPSSVRSVSHVGLDIQSFLSVCLATRLLVAAKPRLEGCLELISAMSTF